MQQQTLEDVSYSPNSLRRFSRGLYGGRLQRVLRAILGVFRLLLM